MRGPTPTAGVRPARLGASARVRRGRHRPRGAAQRRGREVRRARLGRFGSEAWAPSRNSKRRPSWAMRPPGAASFIACPTPTPSFISTYPPPHSFLVFRSFPQSPILFSFFPHHNLIFFSRTQHATRFGFSPFIILFFF